MGMSPPMRCTLLGHECWHVAFLHCDEVRRGDRDPRLWNQACDYAINNMMYEFGYQFDCGLLDPKYNEMSAEQIYDELVKDLPPDLPFGSDIDVGSLSSGAKHQVVGTVIKALQAHAASGGPPGSIPGEISTHIDKLMNPKLPWYVLLRRWLNEKSDFGRNWAMPNRRYHALGVYLPSSGGQEGLSHLLFGCDDSGSMSDENLGFMNAEMKGCRDRLKPASMTAVSFDTQINDHWEFTDQDDLSRLEFHGRGGTDIEPLFAFAKAQKKRPNLIVVMSDLECGIPDNPGIPVLWVRFGNNGAIPPYGKIIQVDR